MHSLRLQLFLLLTCLFQVSQCEELHCRSHALDSRHSAAVVHYMLEVLPELHDNSSTSAASLLLHTLTSSALPAQLLQSTTALLIKLPLTDEPSSAPCGSQLRLACELLQSFTAEAFQALPKGKGKAAKGAASPTVAGLEVLLRLVKYGVTEGDGQSAEKLRLAAFQQLGAELYAVMPVQQQMEAFLVSAFLTPPPLLPPLPQSCQLAVTTLCLPCQLFGCLLSASMVHWAVESAVVLWSQGLRQIYASAP